jgi:hypothetical protein
MMKSKFLTFIAVMLLSVSLNAQDLVDMIKRDINAERRTIVAEAMTIPTDKEAEFWALYNEMEQKLGVLTDMRVANINKYAENYENITDDIAHDLANTYFNIQIDRLKVYKTYYKKVAKLISKKEASRFVQLLGQIQLILDMQVAAEVPLIE